ncbi:DUF3267 domain-containing protein [Helcococcus ovis]|uniref:DUF3267 domain-containing protein n=2 Tax=Helcococcus ovis TaxID=72026 RepID=UPI0038BBC0C4
MDMGKKERKLTPKEQKRKEKFEELSSEMIKMGYKKTDLTLGTLTANLLAIPIMLPFMALGLLIFKLTQANVKIIIMIEIFDLIILFGILLVLIVIHELIHGLTWGAFAKNHFKSIDFGFIWSTLTPYCTCNETLKKWQYILGGLMPTLVLGFGILAAACILHNIFLFMIAELMIVSGGGDFLIVFKILLYKSKENDVYYYDHPYECGVVVFEK